MTLPRKNQQQLLYINRINKVVEFIETNLDSDLSLNVLSEIACFSPFHFHRVFTALLNETPNQFITRRRIEKISNHLLLGESRSLTTLAQQYGFKSIHSFSRAFRNYYGISASEFQKIGQNEFSKIRKMKSKNGAEKVSFEKYICSINNLKNWLQMKTQVEVKEMPELKLAHIRHQGAFSDIGKAFQKLTRWAGPRGLLNFPKTKMASIFYDTPRVTEISKLQSSACISIEKDIETSGEIGQITIPKGKFAVGSFEIKMDEFEQAWNSMVLWVPGNDFQVRDGYYHEIYRNDGNQHPEGLFFVDICIPVQ